MSLLTQSDQRKGENFNGQLLYRKVEQAVVNEAIALHDANGASPARKAWAVGIQDNPASVMQRVMSRVILKNQVATSGGESGDNPIETEVRAALLLIAPV